MKKMFMAMLALAMTLMLLPACGGGAGGDKSQPAGTGSSIPQLETASQLGAVAVQGYVYARMLTDQIVAVDIKTADKAQLAALVTEACSAWEAVDVVCGQMSEYASAAQVGSGSQGSTTQVKYSPQSSPVQAKKSSQDSATLQTESGNGLSFVTKAYAAEDDMKKWAEDINSMYDNMTDKNLKTRDRFKQLAEQLGTDARGAAKQLQMANEILSDEYTAEGDYYRAWENCAMTTKTVCKVGLFVGGIIASGGTIGATGITLMGGETALGTAAIVGAFVTGGADCMVDVANTGSNIFLGDGHVATKYFQGLADKVAPVSTAFNIANLGGATAGEVLSLVGENMVSWYQEGKVGGVTISNPAKSYLPSEEEQPKPEYYIDVTGKTEAEAIAAVEEAGGPTLPAENSISLESWLEHLDITAEDIISMADAICTAAAAAAANEPAGDAVGELPVAPGTYTATPQLSNTTRYSDVYKVTETITCSDIKITVSNKKSVSLSYDYAKSGSTSGNYGTAGDTETTTLSSKMPVNIENLELIQQGDEYIASGEFKAQMASKSTVVTHTKEVVDGAGNVVMEAHDDVFENTSDNEFTITYNITFTKDSFSGTLQQGEDTTARAYNIITFSGEF